MWETRERFLVAYGPAIKPLRKTLKYVYKCGY